MTRHRSGDAERADASVTPAQGAKILRRLNYLVTNRHRLHEASLLVDFAVRFNAALAPDIRHLTQDVVAWKAERGLS